MKLPLLQLFLTVLFFGLVGCATTTKTKSPAIKSDRSDSSVAPATGPASSPEPTPLSTKKGTLPAGEYAVLVESVPDGAIVVVNGIPVGKAPQRILLPGTQRGFFRDQVSLKVRFIGSDAAHPSQTVEELLTPLDRIPTAVRFTPTGATRLTK